MSVKDYAGNGIVVHWDAVRCEHSTRCVQGAPSVFDPTARPWVTATAVDADTLAAVIDTCPSGALSYTRTDGVAHGRRGHTADEDPTVARRPDGGSADGAPDDRLSVTPRSNGPLVVEGPVALVGPDGTREVSERLFLCRCGASANKPMCDGSHKRVGFEAAGVSPSDRSSSPPARPAPVHVTEPPASVRASADDGSAGARRRRRPG